MATLHRPRRRQRVRPRVRHRSVCKGGGLVYRKPRVLRGYRDQRVLAGRTCCCCRHRRSWRARRCCTTNDQGRETLGLRKKSLPTFGSSVSVLATSGSAMACRPSDRPAAKKDMEDAQKKQLTAKKVHPLKRKTYEELLDALDQTESLKGYA